MSQPQPVDTPQWDDQIRCPETLPAASARCSLPRRHHETHHRCDAVEPAVRWPVDGGTPERFDVTGSGFWSPLHPEDAR
ncbi:hypothetical protein ACFYUY_01705 [Kitasatospora sp. NPDC004745]|uniref:hypothetical protein n=1 Tax=Kitasatospora sp. NPDC004745 TaxID=3364019 RepID=UPI0036BC5FCE